MRGVLNCWTDDSQNCGRLFSAISKDDKLNINCSLGEREREKEIEILIVNTEKIGTLLN